MKKFALLTLLCLLCISCTSKQENTIVVDADLKDLINQKNNILEELYAKGAIDSAATYFDPNLIQLPPNATALKGKDAYIEEWKNMTAIGDWKFNLEAVEVRRSGPMAVELGQYTLEFNPNEQSPMPGFTDKGHYLVLWEKRDTDWKIVWDAPVSELPLPANEPLSDK